MTIRKIAFAVATLTALSPAISNASPERASAKACARAFVSSIAAQGAAAPMYKLSYRGGMGMGSSLTDFYPTEYTFTLEAHDPKTGLAVARALCSTNSRGAVTALSAMPLENKPATLAAGF
jgi:hypothetical protein